MCIKTQETPQPAANNNFVVARYLSSRDHIPFHFTFRPRSSYPAASATPLLSPFAQAAFYRLHI